ncbi:MAG: hypothetical protein IJ373_00460 [Clostridia bacterium]|nr:hypothetical protein [Clostridia bacterium]
MEKTKEQMIADLYALRGGLSVISEHTDEIRRQEELMISANELLDKDVRFAEQENEKKVSDLRREKRKYEELANKQDSKLDDVRNAQEQKIEKLENLMKNRAKLRGRAKRLKSVRLANLFWSLACLVLVICLIWMMVKKDYFIRGVRGRDVWGNHVDITGVRFVLGILACLIMLAVLFELYVQFCIIPSERKYLIEEKQEYKKVMHNAENRLEAYKNQLESLPFRIKYFEEKQQEEGVKNKQQLQKIGIRIKDSKNKIEEISEQSKLIKGTLNETYDTWLAESDWKNVDLLIYYLETNRADDLKEALQLVDKQRQTESIAKAIATAARAIQDTVHTATMRLAGAMEASFSLLSDKLSAINAKMGRLSTLVEQSTDMGEQMAKMQREQLAVQNKLLSTEKLNGALLEKANRSSEELLNDLRYGQRYWVK